MTDWLQPGPGGTWARVRNAEAAAAGRPAAASQSGVNVTASAPYQVSIVQRDPPNHGIVANLHDKPPTPSEGGGGWEEVTLPKRGSVLIWRGRGLMKQSFSLVFDSFLDEASVIDDAYRTLLKFWRPEGTSAADDSTVEPSVLILGAQGDAIPYKNLAWVVSELSWGPAQGDAEGQRTQQIIELTMTEFRADERLRGAPHKAARTKPYKWKKGDTLKSVAKHFHTTPAKLGAMQKPPIKDGRKIKVHQVIVVPA